MPTMTTTPDTTVQPLGRHIANEVRLLHLIQHRTAF